LREQNDRESRAKPAWLALLWIPGRAFGPPGMTRQDRRAKNGSTEFAPQAQPATRRKPIAGAAEKGNKDIKISLCPSAEQAESRQQNETNAPESRHA
jgi:hypothetical protein